MVIGLYDTQKKIQAYMKKMTNPKIVTDKEHQVEAEEETREPLNSFFSNVLKIVGVRGGKNGRKERKRK